MNMTRLTRSAGASSATVAHQGAAGAQPDMRRVSACLKYPGRSFVHVEPDLSCDWGRAPSLPHTRNGGPVFG